MGVYLNPRFDYFLEKLNTPTFVDKSELISICNSKVCTDKKWMGVSRPRRFGKSLAARMLLAYYTKAYDTRKIFSELKISKLPNWDKHLNKYDVIYLDLIDIDRKAKSAKLNIVDFIDKYTLMELKDTYPSYINENIFSLAQGLEKINVETGNKFIIIIDEWDKLFRDEEQEKESQKKYIEFLNEIFKGGSATNFTALAYVTGILPIQKYKTESKMNNFDEYSIVNPDGLARYIGFTETEVKDLCLKFNVSYNDMASWYDGYRIDNEQHIFTPNSVVSALMFNNLKSYWPNTGSFESLKVPITMNFWGLKDSITKLVNDESIKIDASKFQSDMVNLKSKNDVLTLLVHLGYLSYNTQTKYVRIPNKEIKMEFQNTLMDCKQFRIGKILKTSDDILSATLEKDISTISELFDQVHNKTANLFNYNNENALLSTLQQGYIMAENDYEVLKELPAGKGRADLVYKPFPYCSKPALVVELKWNKTTDSAIKQIKERKYVECLKDNYHGKVLLVGINYNSTSKKHECKIEEMIV